MMEEYKFRLYVTGQTPRSAHAISNLKQICDTILEGRGNFDVIDILTEPQIAEDELILATPTVARIRPLPQRRVIGDLSDTERVLLGLQIPLPTS
ncbi:MAG: circadian clock protein KaiB [candidate division Zixibacteria bacterium]|nr:circadian clock protein KaiB [candidate division Zixibacteria bacterium]